MLAPGQSRQRIAQTLNAAYGDGLLSQDTLLRRLDQLLDARLVDPSGLIGDLNLRSSRHEWRAALADAVRATMRRVERSTAAVIDCRAVLLALDWSGGQSELLLGRDQDCDIVLSDLRVSRRHARLLFRDGRWVLQDLQSTNGTTVNGVSVGRCELRPGDSLILGGERLQID